MYISSININNYKNFESISVDFKDGINLLVGQNNAGKSNILRALATIFDPKARKQLPIDDIYMNISLDQLKKHSPKVTISIILSQSEEEELIGDELVTVSNWLIKLKEPYEAKIQYEFFLPETEEDEYKNSVEHITNQLEIWEVIKKHFIRRYIYKIWVGDPKNQVQIDNENLSKFDFQFLDAIRDVERDMFSGRNTLLKDIIEFFIDYDIKSNKDLTESERFEELNQRKDKFNDASQVLIDIIHERLKTGKSEILSYTEDIGVVFENLSPDLEGKVTESEIYTILQLIVKQRTGISIPITNNGLGYNNLIFMSLLLAKMQIDSNGVYLGSNAKVFPILAIEEPEAHLHPTMQYQLIDFLRKNLTDNKVRQIFITSHSTHITSSTSLNDIICLYKNDDNTNVSYPGKVFYDINSEGRVTENSDSKKYVQRFLDATKANLLFSEKIILVEGMAEQLLIPVFAEYLGFSLEKQHVTVINIGGRYFEHFLYLFDSLKENVMKRKIACITDIDPVRRTEGSNFKKCYPFEVDSNSQEYEYKWNTSMDKYNNNSNHPNIRSFFQNERYGKTLEYQLAFDNYENEILITPSIQNKDELTELIKKNKNKVELQELIETLRNSEENDRIKCSINSAKTDIWDEESKKKAVFASRYLNSVGKGENALELSSLLKENLQLKDTEKFQNFNIPEYIKEAIEWICD